MNKQEMITAMSLKMEVNKKEAEKALIAFTEVVTEALVAKDKVSLVGFGSFEVTERAARDGRNPSTGEPLYIEASVAPKFKAGKALKNAVNGK